MDLVRKDYTPPSFSFRGLLYTSFLLLLVVSLFFIPEIVKFQEKISSPSGTPTTSSVVEPNVNESVDIEEILPPSQGTGGKTLDNIWSMVQGGALEGSDSGLNVSAPVGEVESPNVMQDRLLLEKTIGQGAVTWEQLNKKEVKAAFKGAQTRAAKIFKGLSERQSAVRFALINYINGLAWITRGDRKLMSADEALAYIEQLDINVTQAMLTSETDAADFEAWKQVSFGSLPGSGRASAFKVGRAIRFNPRLNLISVEIRRDSDWIVNKKGVARPRKSPRSSIEISGFVIGKDVRRITIFRNGKRLRDIKVSKKESEEGLRGFKFRHKKADGLYTLRAVSSTGETYEKSYVFLGKVFNRFRQDEDGYYLLPFGQRDADEVSLRGLDTRLDRFFRVNIRGESESRGFDTF